MRVPQAPTGGRAPQAEQRVGACRWEMLSGFSENTAQSGAPLGPGVRGRAVCVEIRGSWGSFGPAWASVGRVLRACQWSWDFI